MPHSHYHLHINHFGADIPEPIGSLIDEQGFSPTECEMVDDHTPLWIVTKKFHSRADAENAFSAALDLIPSNCGMNGYMECEVVEPGSVQKFSKTEYDSSWLFPVGRPQFHDAPRGADIHIFRAISTPRDELDTRLLHTGFYEVTTPKERIWTLLLESEIDAVILFEKLKAHFLQAGGASKIEREIVNSLQVVPRGFRLRPVAASGSI